MAAERNIAVPEEALAEYCRAHGVRWLAFFGSVLRDDFGPDSDVDVLVEFEPGRTPGLVGMAAMEIDLGRILGRKVDLRTPTDLSRYFRDEVVGSSEVRYAAG
jgi:predicted nucleotidyltransferase